MATTKTIGFMIYAAEGQERSVFTDEKYQLLAEHVVSSGIQVETILYNNRKSASLRSQLLALDGLLVWVNPIEQGESRSVLDQLLVELHEHGLMISTHPSTIMSIGTKRVLYDTRDMEWGSDVELYRSYADFREQFLHSLQRSPIRILKQFRGDGGNGVFKVSYADSSRQALRVLHARRGSVEEIRTAAELFDDFRPFFDDGRPLINQEWNANLTNGIVRCYMTAAQVVGFGYQEINALYPSSTGVSVPGKRYYFTENCALFSDLKQLMEARWLEQLSRRFALTIDQLPVIWDADFFINQVHSTSQRKYSLCEMNVSCVSPFPESAIPYITAEIWRRLQGHRDS